MKNRKYTTDNFIEAASKIHNNKYSYDDFIYEAWESKSKITCPVHGTFLQKPKFHMKGQGCFQCGRLKTNKGKTTYTNDRFISRAIELYGEKYDYCHVNAAKYEDPVSILCKRCNRIFVMTPRLHLRRMGCPDCAINKKLTTEEFVAKSKLVHGDLYDYSKVVYQVQSKKVCIICKKHGPFHQIARDHIYSGAGCPNCKTSKGEKLVKSILVKLNIPFETQFSFEECRGDTGRPLRFDIAIVENGKFGLIEYQGTQHYHKFGWMTDKSFKDSLRRDEIKKAYCTINNIPLLEIPFFMAYKSRQMIEEFWSKLK